MLLRKDRKYREILRRMRKTETRARRLLDVLLRKDGKYGKILCRMRETQAPGTGNLDLLLRHGQYREILYELRQQKAGSGAAHQMRQMRLGTGRYDKYPEILPQLRRPHWGRG